MFETCVDLVAEYADVEAQLADPAVHSDQVAARRLGRRFAELGPVVAAYREWQGACGDVAAAQELAETDPDFAEEAQQQAAAAAAAQQQQAQQQQAQQRQAQQQQAQQRQQQQQAQQQQQQQR